MPFESQYILPMKNNNFNFYGYNNGSNIEHNTTTEEWRIELLSNSNKHVTTAGALPPLGTKNYIPSEGLGGGQIFLHINACEDRTQFNCQDGSCIPIEKRCNSEFDCKYGDDEIECNLIDIPHSYLSFVPGIISSIFILHNLPLSRLS